MWAFLIVLLLIILLILVAVGIYNTLIRERNDIKNAFAQIDIQLTRRHDLIPNLVEVAKRYMAHEQDTLTQVTQARNQAVSALKNTAGSGGLPDIGKLSAAEGALGKSLGTLYATFESYPELKADQQMRELQEEISSTENRIAFARQHYNDNVKQYNNSTQSFPSNVIAGLFGFKSHEWLEIENMKNKREAIKIDFS
ncbi:LemA family protein [Cardiobacteriaceae bacterium TAE3-ERU3]|nr:LemA family protein [Cardiobacteriaceae bacterium TAE3-ERU3]